MRVRVFLNGCLAALAIVGAACGSQTTTGGAPSAAPSPSTPASTVTIGLATDAKLGKFLVDGAGRTLYLFEADKGTASTCYTACAQYWPPVLSNGAPVAGSGISTALLGTSTRTDGGIEVTYGGHPLYYVVTDKKPGDTTGQGVNNFGAPWDAVGPDGKQIG